MGRIYLGRWEAVLEDWAVTPTWWPPQRERLVGSWLDLRGRDRNGYGLFCYDGAVADPALLVDLGDDLLGRLSAGPRSGLEAAFGAGLAGRTALDVIYELLGGQADPSGEARAKPLLATRRLEYRVHFGDFPVQRRGFDGFESPHGVRSLVVLQADYRRIREDVLAGRLPRDHHRKFLGYLVRKYRPADYRVFIPAGLPDEAPLEPRTTLTETFPTNTTDLTGSADQDQDWTERGNIDVVSGKAENIDTGNIFARVEAALSGDDHYALADCESVTASTSFVGVAARLTDADLASNPAECYMAAYRRNTSFSWIIRKSDVNGAVTTVASAGADPAPGVGPIEIKLEVDGSDLELFADGVSKVTGTDTDITGYLRCGIHFECGGASRAVLDNWEAADLGAAARRRVMLVG